MTQTEVAALVKGIGAAVFVHVNKALGEFAERIGDVERRLGSVRDGRDGAPGRDADEAQVLALVAEVKALRDEMAVLKMAPVEAMLEPLEAPAMDVLVKAAVAEAVAQLPIPQDGKDGASVTVDELLPVITAEVVKAVAALPAAKDGAPGASVDMDDVEALVIKAVAQLPKPQDGASVTVEDVRPLIAGEVEKAVAAIPPAKDGKDGVSVFGGVIDRDNHLVLTLSDGTVKDFGVVVGRDGRDADMAALEQRIVSELEKWPRPKDGEPGPPGRDGTLDDVKFVPSEDFRTITVHRKDGTAIEGGVLSFPVVIDRGVFKAGETYQAGDGVTWGGSFWIAQRETNEKPGEGPTGWRLSVKRGGTGPKGDPGTNGINGKDGAPGRDGTKPW